jgi:hypothetical protein
MSMDSDAACLALKSASVIFRAPTALASSASVLASFGSRSAQRSLRPSTVRRSSPGTCAKSAPPSTISWIAWSNGMVVHVFAPRGPARFSTFTIR